MPGKKRGKQTVVFHNPPVITSSASIVGPDEGKGPFGSYFDQVLPDYMFGEKTWEKAESKMLREAVKLAINKANLKEDDIEVILAGDLLNQTISANYAARDLSLPLLGLYGACSTMAESLLLGAMLVDGGFFSKVVAATSSHHHTAERQFRFPTEQGVQPTVTTQWTATAAGAVVLQSEGSGPRITAATVGKVVDMGQKDMSNMGSAMAPAAVDTIKAHLDDLKRSPDYYDLILTGDLGKIGKAIAEELFVVKGIVPKPFYNDCGVLLYDENQDVNAGGSGCGCAACMLCGPLLKKMQEGSLKKLLLVATGALMSPTSMFQGESIPCVAHAVAVEMN
ncbi:stage V sporulation protein AD [Thermosyntropha lipolytica DSM 11003]|uniref:Stage V sporulation protein AD n=1 Tax=Thermosyntropha lipolytica DSM 11003 TaxID=1123382 RepID=A0A1M5M352_9FIRM|nr:stage V sporulation protein AD [Thermosyntropha lipolytica]SHG71752.1 stage V sporulation protein AD [Thermosyntropha lipolytica DSM 11003]